MRAISVSKAVRLYLLSLDGVKSPATVTWYQARLAGLEDQLGQISIDRVSTDKLRLWRAGLTRRGQLSDWTIHGHVRAVRRMFAWLVEEGRLKASPATRLELPHIAFEPKRGIDRADMLAIIAAANSPRDFALVLFLGDTACRRGGLAHLLIEDVDLDRGRALVREKGDKTRPVYFGPRTRAALREYIGGRMSGPVFVSLTTGAQLTADGVYQVLKRLALYAGVSERWNPHSWRHGAARGMLRRGANLAQVSQILGHADVGVTVKFYGSFVDSELAACHAKYGWLPGGE